MPRVLITVAEASADFHAANLIRALKELDPTIQVDALGGPRMHAAGATLHHDMTLNAAMGLAAVSRAREVSHMLKWARKFLNDNKVDLHICCDSWSMNYHFARLARRQG